MSSRFSAERAKNNWAKAKEAVLGLPKIHEGGRTKPAIGALPVKSSALAKQQGTLYYGSQVRSRTPSPGRSSSPAVTPSTKPTPPPLLTADIYLTWEGNDMHLVARFNKIQKVRLPTSLYDKIARFLKDHGYVPCGFALKPEYLVLAASGQAFYISKCKEEGLPKHIPTVFSGNEVRTLQPRQSSSSLSQKNQASRKPAAPIVVLDGDLSMTLNVPHKICAFEVKGRVVILKDTIRLEVDKFLQKQTGGAIRRATLPGVGVVMKETTAGWEIARVDFSKIPRN